MFTHQVLFRIQKRNLPLYLADCRMWGKMAHQQLGFVAHGTWIRVDAKDQYVSSYTWKAEKYHRVFMKKYHDVLVSKSQCPVEVLGYYNFKSLVGGPSL